MNGFLLSALIDDRPSQADELIGFTIFATPVIVVGGAQGVAVWYLWTSLSPVSQSSSICTNQPIFSISVIGIFILYLLAGLKDIIHEMKIVRYATEVFGYDENGKAYQEVVGNQTFIAILISFIIIGYELLIWMSVLLIGIFYIFTSDGIGNIIQAAVAIAFINDVDNVAIYVLYPKNHVEYPKRFRVRGAQSEHATFFWFRFGAIIIVCAVVGIVFGTKQYNC